VIRLLERDPAALCVTHYGCVRHAAHLKRLLLEQIDDLAAIGERQRRADDRHRGLCRELTALYRRRLSEHGFADVDAAMQWLAMDVEINAQGLASWLDRTSRR
jgi:hypothetical protein